MLSSVLTADRLWHASRGVAYDFLLQVHQAHGHPLGEPPPPRHEHTQNLEASRYHSYPQAQKWCLRPRQ